MSKPTIGTLFSGGGIGVALVKDQYDIAWGVEYDAAIAEVYKANISPNIIVSRVQDADPCKLDKVDLLQASPVCKEFSAAKTGGKESAEEISQAEAICKFIQVLQPRFFILENVRGYVHSQSFQMIVTALVNWGYWIDCEIQYNLFDGVKVVGANILNSADFGVPQTRERLILRASKDGPLPALPKPIRWVGWYEAIEDLIPSLPESEFADWQLQRLPENLMEFIAPGANSSFAYQEKSKPCFTVTTAVPPVKAFLIPGDNASNSTIRDCDEPFVTVTNSHSTGSHRAFICEGTSSSENFAMPLRCESEPMFTVKAAIGKSVTRAFIVDGQPNANGRLLTVRHGQEPVYTIQASANHKPARAWLSQGRVVKMTPRTLARFQSIPDSYQLPEKNALACTVIGNGVPSLLGKTLIEGLLNAR